MLNLARGKLGKVARAALALIAFGLALYLFYGPVPDNNAVTIGLIFVVCVLGLWLAVLYVFENHKEGENNTNT